MPVRRSLIYVHVGALLFITLLSTVSLGQQHERSQTPEKYKWDLTAIYPSDDAWRAAKEKFVAQMPTLHQFQGKMATSAKMLADTLETQSNLQKEFSRLYVYTSLLSDLDTRVSANQAMKQEMSQIGSKFGAETAFIEPEILKMDPSPDRPLHSSGTSPQDLPPCSG